MTDSQHEVERLSEAVRTAIWDAIERHIDAAPVDGVSADGSYSFEVDCQQQGYVGGLRAGRLAAMNAATALLNDINRKPTPEGK